MAGVRRVINTAALQKVLKDSSEKATWAAARKVEERAKELCSSKTVAETIRASVGPRGSITVGSPLPLARWIEKGTGVYGPHHTPIVPVTSTVLVFPGTRGMVFTKSAQGQPARPFLEPALLVLHK